MTKKIYIAIGIIMVLVIMFFVAEGHYPTNMVNQYIQNGDTEAALELIEKSDLSDLNRKSHSAFGSTINVIFDTMTPSGYPICHACWHGNLQITQALLDKGVDVNVNEGPFGDTPLLLVLQSASTDKYKIANLLLDHGADISVVDDRGDTALSLAEEKDYQVLEDPELNQQRINLLIRMGYTGGNW